MTLPQYGQPIARMDPIELGDLDGVVIAAPAGGDILIYDGANWRNRTVTGDITISAGGVVALVVGLARQILQTNAAGLAAEWTSNMDGVTIGAATPAPGTFNTLTKTGTTGLTWTNVSDEDYEIFFLSGVTGGPRWIWDETEDAWSTNFGIEITNGSIDLNNQGSIINVGAAGSDWTAAGLSMGDAAGPTVLNAAAAVGTPTFIPNKADPDTGVAWSSSNTLTLAAQGRAVIFVHSAAGASGEVDITAVRIRNEGTTLPNSASARYRYIATDNINITLAGTTQVTTLNQGMGLAIGEITLTESGGAVTVDQASTLHVPVITVGGSVTITANRMISTGVADCYLTVGGVWTDTSSKKYKHDITPVDLRRIPGLLDTIPLVSFRRNDIGNDGGFERFGFIAEDAPDFLVSPTHRSSAAIHVAGFALVVTKYHEYVLREHEAHFSTLEERLAGVERANEILAAQVADLGGKPEV